MEDEGEIARRKGSIRLAYPGHAAIPEEGDAAR